MTTTTAPPVPALPVRGDIFVCRQPNGAEFTALTVVSTTNYVVNLAAPIVRRDCLRHRLKLRLRLDPDTREFHILHAKRTYYLDRRTSSEYEENKPVDAVFVAPPFDARTHCKVGDILTERTSWDHSYASRPTATVVKVTRCYVTYMKAEQHPRTIKGKASLWREESVLRVGGQGDFVWMEKQL